jgi:hypothetical protein
MVGFSSLGTLYEYQTGTPKIIKISVVTKLNLKIKEFKQNICPKTHRPRLAVAIYQSSFSRIQLPDVYFLDKYRIYKIPY